MQKKSTGLLVLAFSLACGFQATRAAWAGTIEDMLKNVGTSGGKLIANTVFKAAADYVYKNHCGTASHDVEQLLCGALGSYTGAKEKEWKENVTSELAAIRGDLERLEQGQQRIQADVRALLAGNQELLSKVSSLVNETVAQTRLREIQALWDQQFESLFVGESSFSREQLLSFAEQIVRVQQMHTKLGVISKTLTTNGIAGADPLLFAWARTLNVQLAAAPGEPDLETAYTFMEQSLADLLFEQRKGFLMYTWAAQILESDCTIRQARGETNCAKAPLSGVDFQKVFDKQIAQQLETFIESVEWLVLANSDPHSDKAAFLHRDAQRIFWRLDLFSGANQQSFGLYGRVISMGDRFDGKLEVASREMPLAKTSLIPTEDGSLDWWRATDAKKPGTYDEVRFAKQWRVLHYWTAEVSEKDARVTSPRLPYAEPFAIARIDLLTGKPTEAPLSGTVKLFGSFTAIERAGGGFALTSGEWKTRIPEPVVKFDSHAVNLAGKSQRAHSVAQGKPGLFFAAVELHGRLLHTFKLVNVDRPTYRATRKAAVWTNKKIRYVPGGTLRLHIDPIAGFVHLPDRKPDGTVEAWGYSDDYAPSTVAVGLKTTFQLGGINPKPAILAGKAALVFGTYGSTNGFVHAKKVTATSPEAVHLDWTERSVLVTLDAGKSYPLLLETEASVSQEPSGYNSTEFSLIANGKFSNAYLTEK